MPNILKALQGASGNAGEALYAEDVFTPNLYDGNDSSQSVVTGVDIETYGGLVWLKNRGLATNHNLTDSVRGVNSQLITNSTAAEATATNVITSFNSDGFSLENSGITNSSGYPYVAWTFRNCSGFFHHEEVTKSASSDATVDLSSLGTVGMVAVKRTDSAGSWFVWHRSATAGDLLYLEQTAAETLDGSITVSGTTLTLEDGVIADGTYIVYAWAHDEQIFGDNSDESIIKCGSYTGNGTSQTIDCGFSGGARFILIKSTSTTGSWWVYDSARGIVAGNDPALQLNSTAAEVTSADAIDPDSSGFIVNQEATCSINASGVSYIFMSIA